MQSTEPVAARSEGVYRQIWREIVEGVLVPGSRLKERELSERHAVSRIPVRQALQRLEAEGFVVAQPNRGARVAEIVREDVQELFDARLCIEPFAARRAATRARSVHGAVERLGDCLNRTLAPANPQAAGAATLDFHAEVVRLSGNTLLTRAHAPLLGRMELVFRLTPDTRESEHADEHRRMLRAIAEGNAELAGVQAHAHIELARESVMEALAVRLGW